MNRDIILNQMATLLHSWDTEGTQVKFEHSQPTTITDKDMQKAKQLLNYIGELVTVDKGAVPPQNPYNRFRVNKEKNSPYKVYEMAQRDMRIDGWVKLIPNTGSSGN